MPWNRLPRLGANLSDEVDVFRFHSCGLLVCCVSNAFRSALPEKPEFSGGEVVVEGKVSGGGMKQSVSFLEPHRLPGEQHLPPLRSSERACRRGERKKKKKDECGATPKVSQRRRRRLERPDSRC